MNGALPPRAPTSLATPFPVTVRSVLIGSQGDRVLARACARAGLRILATVSEVEAAVAVVHSVRPDLVIVDARSSHGDGLAVARRLGSSTPMMLVSDNAADAAEAFACEAVGFALGAFDQAAFERVAVRLRPAVEAARSGAEGRLIVRDGARTVVCPTKLLVWIEAAGNYVRLHREHSHQLVRCTLAAIETKLEPTTFVRIHRRTIVNVDYVATVTPAGRDLAVELAGRRRLAVGRSYRPRLDAVLGMSCGRPR